MSEPAATSAPSAAAATAPATAPVHDEVALAETPGSHLFQDVFRRADKNDDGRVSWQEFVRYFQDDHLSNEDMKAMFDSIDTDKSGNIDLQELMAYFTTGFSPYVDLFKSLEMCHHTISTALLETRKNYATQSVAEQFKSRFFLKEFLLQLESLSNPVDIALDKIYEVTERRRDFKRVNIPDLNGFGGLSDRLQGSGLGAGAATVGVAGVEWEGSGAEDHHSGHHTLQYQVNRLATLIGKLEQNHAIKLELPEEDKAFFSAQGDSENTEAFVIVSSEYDVIGESDQTFVDALKTYIRGTRTEDGSQYMYVKKKGDESHVYLVYEIWAGDDSLASHYQSAHYKEFAKSNLDTLHKPPKVKSLEVPAEWWPSDN